METETQKEKQPLIWGVKRIVIDDEVHDIYEKLEAYKRELVPGEVIEEAKLRVSVVGDVAFKHVRKYLERFFSYRVHRIIFNTWSSLHIGKRKMLEKTPFGLLEYEVDSEVEGLKTVIEKAVEKEKPLFRDVFEYLANKKFKDYADSTIRLFDQATSILLVNEREMPEDIRKVKALQGRAKDEAEKKGLNPDDLVIVTPEYIEKIDGDPVSFLLKRAKTEKPRKTHAVVFGCAGDCRPQLELTSEEDDYTAFISFFRSKGYAIRVSLCVVTMKPKTRTDYVKRQVEGFERAEKCAVL